jgi:hypothetical protein
MKTHSTSGGSRSFLAALATIALCGMAQPAQAQLFTQGDLIVSVYGNVGNAATSSNFTMSLPTPEASFIDGVPTPISLLEFSPSAPVNSLPIVTYTMPTANIGLNFGIVGEYGSSSEGTIQLSGDGRYLTVNGYSAVPSIQGIGSPGGLGYFNANPISVDALAQATSANVPRVFALVDANGNVNSSTVLNNLFSTNNPRSSYTLNGTVLYLSGQGSGSSDQGIYMVATGTNNVISPGNNATRIYNNTDTRTVLANSGNLYFSEDKPNKPTGVFAYNGLPLNSTQTPTNLTGSTNGVGNFSPEGIYFANATTMYVADTGVPKKGAPGVGGIQKWSLVGGNWTLDYVLIDPNFTTNITASDGETGFEAITGKLVGSGANTTVQLFAVSYTLGDADPDGLYAITDMLSSSVLPAGEDFTEIEASGPNNVFKGVSFAPVPEPGEAALLGGLGCLAAAWGQWRRRASRMRGKQVAQE